jgi:spore coat protein CotH
MNAPRWVSCVLVAVTCALGCNHYLGDQPIAADVVWNPAESRSSAKSLSVYDESRVVDFHVTFPPGEWEKLVTSREPNPDLRWVSCGLSFGGETAPAAACRRKGNMFDWDQAPKPQFVVRFNLTDKQGRFRGLRRLNFESWDGVEAPVRDRIGMWVMREAGLPAPRVNHARVFKDGTLLGVYMNVEAIDKEFIEDQFEPEDGGNLWEEGELKTNEDLNDRSRYVALNKLVEAEPLEGDHTVFFATLAAMIDVPEVLREIAVETALVASDNFSNGSPRNFFWYEHPSRGFVLLPWDLDSIFMSPPESDPFAFWANQKPNKLRQLMNQNPVWREAYVAALIDVRDNVLARAPSRLRAICAQIEPPMREDRMRRFTFEAFQTDCAGLGVRIEQRIAALRQALGR